MFNKNKKKKIFLLITVIILCFCFSFVFCGCSNHKDASDSKATTASSSETTTTSVKEFIPQEFKLLSAYVEIRNVTNQFGGIIRTDKYFHYSFSTNSGDVLFKEKQMYDTYYTTYALKFKIGNENKILQYNYPSQVLLVFEMTEEMYRNVFTEQ